MTQETALNILKSGRNVFLTGAAGSGKTYVLNQYISYLRRHDVSVAVTASTGIAATHLNGTTIHSWCGMGIHDSLLDENIKKLAHNKRLANRVNSAKVLVIDEVSMLDAARLQLINSITRRLRSSQEPFGGLQVVVCGDFFQLPPIQKQGADQSQMAFAGTGWQELDPAICYLSEQHRQEDDQYLAVLNAIRSGDLNDEVYALLEQRLHAPIDHVKPARLFPHNFNVDTKNDAELNNIQGPIKSFAMTSSGNKKLVEGLIKSCLAPEKLTLKKNATVMFVKNDFEHKVVNGTMGLVIGFDAERGYPIVKTKTGQVFAEPASWHIENDDGKPLAQITQIPLRLAWAITIHKSQGMSLDAAEIDLSRAFSPGMGYVALSRVRSLAGLRLLGFNNMALQVHDLVSGIDSQFKSESQINAQAVQKTDPHELQHQHQDFIRRAGGKLEPQEQKTSKLAALRQKYAKAYMPWNQEEDSLLESMFKSDIATAKMAEFFKRQPGAITARLKKLGLIEE